MSEMTRGPSVEGLCIKEGVCVRIEEPRDFGLKVHDALKHKGFVFCCLEGIAANDPDFVDKEDEV